MGQNDAYSLVSDVELIKMIVIIENFSPIPPFNTLELGTSL